MGDSESARKSAVVFGWVFKGDAAYCCWRHVPANAFPVMYPQSASELAAERKKAADEIERLKAELATVTGNHARQVDTIREFQKLVDGLREEVRQGKLRAAEWHSTAIDRANEIAKLKEEARLRDLVVTQGEQDAEAWRKKYVAMEGLRNHAASEAVRIARLVVERDEEIKELRASLLQAEADTGRWIKNAIEARDELMNGCGTTDFTARTMAPDTPNCNQRRTRLCSHHCPVPMDPGRYVKPTPEETAARAEKCGRCGHPPHPMTCHRPLDNEKFCLCYSSPPW